MARIVIDPGHGGTTQAGNSTAPGVCGPRGIQEKEITLDIARSVAHHLGSDAVLTRSGDHNLSLGERAQRARNADVFVSIHANSGPPNARGAETYVHSHASPGSRALAAGIQSSLDQVQRGEGFPAGARFGNAGPQDAMMAVLTPAVLGRDTSACLVEVDYLSSPDGEARLGNPRRREIIGQAIADAIRQHLGNPHRLGRSVQALSLQDLVFEVQLVPQETGFSCWAASAAMVVGWSRRQSIDPREIARQIGYWNQYHKDGLDAEDERMFAAWNMRYEAQQTFTVEGFYQVLDSYGPLWIAARVGGPHVRVVYGMTGDGTPDGTTVYIHDPWERGMTTFRPSNTGSSYTLTYRQLVAEIESLAYDELGRRNPIYIAHMRDRRIALGAGGRFGRGTLARVDNSQPRAGRYRVPASNVSNGGPFTLQQFYVANNEVTFEFAAIGVEPTDPVEFQGPVNAEVHVVLSSYSDGTELGRHRVEIVDQQRGYITFTGSAEDPIDTMCNYTVTVYNRINPSQGLTLRMWTWT